MKKLSMNGGDLRRESSGEINSYMKTPARVGSKSEEDVKEKKSTKSLIEKYEEMIQRKDLKSYGTKISIPEKHNETLTPYSVKIPENMSYGVKVDSSATESTSSSYGVKVFTKSDEISFYLETPTAYSETPRDIPSKEDCQSAETLYECLFEAGVSEVSKKSSNLYIRDSEMNTKRKLQHKNSLYFEVKPTKGAVRDWGEEYRLLSNKISEDVTNINSWSNLRELAQEFSETATLYAKIIISEMCLPDGLKTIKPVALGGIAGGQKFKYQNIIFKFALDTKIMNDPPFWMHGGTSGPNDMMAMKAGANELKGLEAHSSTHVPGLKYPLMAMIDFKGYRLIAICALPISSSTLRYGSGDSGKTVHKDIQELNEKMKAAGEILNLKGHMTGLRDDAKELIYGPGDIEGHIADNSEYYVVDFGRVLPPEDPRVRKNANTRVVFSQLLRAELVKNYKTPLCSDAFTSWNSDENLDVREQHNQEVSEATEYLYNTLIPNLAAEWDQLDMKNFQGPFTTKDQIKSALNFFSHGHVHEKGLNLRHLGYIRDKVTSEQIRRILLSMCIGRIAKNRMNTAMRAEMLKVQSPSDEPFKLLLIEEFNLLLGHNKASSTFWTDEVKWELKNKYGKCLSAEEDGDHYDIRKSLDISVLMIYLLRVLRIQIKAKATKQLIKHTTDFLFVDADIKGFKERTKHIDAVYIADAISLLFRAMSMNSSEEKRRMLTCADQRFKLAHDCCPTCPIVFFQWGSSLFELAKETSKRELKERIFARAIRCFENSSKTPSAIAACGFLAHVWVKCIRSLASYLQSVNEPDHVIKSYLQRAEEIEKDKEGLVVPAMSNCKAHLLKLFAD